jgi:fibronectin-binding autotransporter adhesin
VLTISNAATAAFSGTIAGTGSIMKSNTFTETFSGNNTYSGTTSVNGGKLSIANANGLGAASAGTTVASGAELLFDGAAQNFTIAEPIAISGVGAGDGGGITVQNSANVTFGGPITLNADSTITVAGSATCAYNNAAAFTGSGKSLTLAGGAGAGAGGTISGALSLGAGGLTKNQGGTWVLSNSGNSYSGATTVAAGVLSLGAANALPSTTTVNFSGATKPLEVKAVLASVRTVP